MDLPFKSLFKCNPYPSGHTQTHLTFCIKVSWFNPLADNDWDIEREVRKASRELNNLTSKMDDLQKIETLQKRVAEHFAEMKRLERDNLKNKKRGDMFQKEKDHAKNELNKTMTLKEKLERLCRELQRENNRLKVGLHRLLCCFALLIEKLE